MKSSNISNQIRHKSAILFIIVSLLVSSLSLIPNVIAFKQSQIEKDITVDTAYYLIKHQKKYPDLVILDVRNPIEYNLGHLYNAILIPLNDIEARINELEEYKNNEIIIYCKSGIKSALASELLVEYGFTKGYNMIGGILAWIDADYPIWTTTHQITVDEIANTKFELSIEPLLLYYSECQSCNENHECSSQSESLSITSEVLEQGEDHITVLKKYELNGIVYEYIHTHTILWSYNKFARRINKTAYFISTEITSENYYLQYYQLDYLINHENYNLRIHTHLAPENSETYDNSFTSVVYTPVNEKPITTMEFVKFNMPVKLSQQYVILAEISNKMAKVYRNSKDRNLKDFHFAYIDMEKGIKSLSKLVKEQLVEYDYQILENYAILADYIPDPIPPPPPPPPPPTGCIPSALECAFSGIICGGALGLILGCAIFSSGSAFWLCIWGLGAIAQDVICACIAVCCCLGNDVCCIANCAC